MICLNVCVQVAFGSPAAATLQRGDIITKIGNYDARDVRHQDAQTLFKNSGTGIKVVVQRYENENINFIEVIIYETSFIMLICNQIMLMMIFGNAFNCHV